MSSKTMRQRLEGIVNRSTRQRDSMRDKDDAEAMLKMLDKYRETRFYACQDDGDLEPSEFYSAIPDPEGTAEEITDA